MKMMPLFDCHASPIPGKVRVEGKSFFVAFLLLAFEDEAL